jgi:ABC-type lipoprotein export system ATPase subunit
MMYQAKMTKETSKSPVTNLKEIEIYELSEIFQNYYLKKLSEVQENIDNYMKLENQYMNKTASLIKKWKLSERTKQILELNNTLTDVKKSVEASTADSVIQKKN